MIKLLSRVLYLLVVLSLAGCSDRTGASGFDAGTVERRVFRPRAGRVRAPPPHNIHEGGIGPYKLGASRKEIYKVLSHGPRVELLNIDRVVDYSLVRTEQDGLLIGTSRRSGVQFLVAVDADIAHAEGGPIIGLAVDEIENVAGQLAVRNRATDPRIRVHVGLPNTRIITDGKRVEAVVVTPSTNTSDRPDPAPAEPGGDAVESGDAGVPAAPPARPSCHRVLAMRKNEKRIRALSKISAARSPVLAYGCGSQALVIVTAGDQIAVISGADEKPRRATSSSVDGLVFAAPLDIDGDGADEIAAVTRRASERSVTFRVELFETDMTTIASRDAYELVAATVRWVGAERLEDTDLLLELESASPGQIRIGGIYIQRSRATLRNVAPLKTKMLRVRRRRASASKSTDRGPIRARPLPPPPDGGKKSTP